MKLSSKFQYQKGAIKTFDRKRSAPGIVLFQYQKGAIKTLHQPLGANHVAVDFNTKKVRLKLNKKPLKPHRRHLFQYQKGAIKTLPARAMDSRSVQFQYQKGAIKTCARAISV